MSRQGELPGANPALIDMLAADGTLDEILSGHGLRFDSPPPPPPLPEPEPFRPPAPDWYEEERQRLELEREQSRQERERVIAEELEKLTDDQADPEPLPKRRGWKTREAQR